MAFFRIIFFLLFFAPAMFFLSGCYDDAFLEAMKEEIDFIAPFDVVLSDEDEAIRTTYFQIPDINTTGNYTVNPESVAGVTTHGTAADGEDNVVLDNTTGLMWMRCTAIDKDNADTTDDCSGTHAPVEWIYAAEFCKKTMNGIDSSGNDTLPHYAGFNNWRLPRISELMSIINFNNSDPAIDITVFPNTINLTDGGYWTFTSKLFIGDYYETIDHGWIVFLKTSNAQASSFTNIVDFRRKQKANLTYEKQYVRCVRGGIEDPI